MKRKIINFLVQYLVYTPITAVQFVFGSGIVAFIFWPEYRQQMLDMPLVNLLWIVLIIGAVTFLLTKLLTRIKGHEVEYSYWDPNFEYEITFVDGEVTNVRQTKGGWSIGTTFIVFVNFILSPINLLFN